MNDIKTPLRSYHKLSNELGITLKVKHDDLYPFIGGGSKARKIKYILKDVNKTKSNALVSAGASNSNHARVVALVGAKRGWPVKLIIHDKEDYSSGNLLLMNMAGAELIFVDHDEVSEAMDSAMVSFKEDGYNPYYIWGGGHNVYGMEAYYDAVTEVKEQLDDWVPEYVVHASGTGGTQSGLHVGFEELFPKTEVLGISVARKRKRGEEIVKKGVEDLKKHLGIESYTRPVKFMDNWIGNGYGSMYPELKVIINKVSKFGLITDPTYTGKALLGLYDLCKKESIPKGSNVLFWHTGGLVNLFGNWKEMVNKDFRI